MTIRLRAHHLLCILTYVGRGYTPAFTVNYDVVLDRIAAGEAIELVVGPDDICQPLLSHPECHCHNKSVIWRDAEARAVMATILDLQHGAIALTSFDLVRMRTEFSAGTIRTACQGCEWVGLCDTVASSGFANVRLC